MPRLLKAALVSLFLLTQASLAEHVIVCGGPALRKWENYRTSEDQHDRWWANFVRASTLRMAEIRLAYGKDAPLVWLVYKPGYETRGREDGKPYTTWIAEQASKRGATLIWFSSTDGYISAHNSRPRGSVVTYDYFGHSNKHAFMFDYGNEIMAVSTATLHESHLSRLSSSIFAKNAYCKSWGCHTGSSMSGVWKSKLGLPLEGANGKTVYTMVGRGEMPKGYGGWTR
ncbi:MAG: hypothetical protein NWT08_08540 [Akkermansiaceae bacterium]|jgi:hypothetical protein|nr:hypothetical protein [Akkermansiaceae bacterium]MDP4647992.1 hypothetical protein [Akkermansiaceae bacterium]MDP4719783.1 hypothetical protein [Akkermansiaceae bacterium]MDP4781339.1 hypothetical protein [Akkermansiaceae bacterium]MDP4846094.1 hypothetical protein [Akkermansiaceae bacterium]